MQLGKITSFSDIYNQNPYKMATVDKIRNGLIDKILSIKNKDFLEALDKLVSSSASESEIIELTSEQKNMLEMSEQDIKKGKLISQEAMDKRNMEWLNAMQFGQRLPTCNSLGFQSIGLREIKSANYSKKLIKLVSERTKQIAKKPLIYKATDFKDVRVASLGNFSIYYKVSDENIIITAFWDNRQDSKKLLEILKSNK